MAQPEDKKRVIIKIPAKKHAELKVQLHYDDLTQTAFFRAITEAYVNQDELIVEFIENYKQTKGLQSEHKRKKIGDAISERKKATEKFALGSKEIENIYDLVEKEYPEL